jgi:hypothetical protein
MELELHWRLNALASLHWRDWDGKWVVFDEGSGQTHQMDTLTATALMVIDTVPIPFCELESRIADSLVLPKSRELSDALHRIASGLQSTGLIESVVV